MRATMNVRFAVLLPVLCLGTLVPVHARQLMLDYTAAPRPIRVCILVDPNGNDRNAYLFVGLSRASIRPRGYDFTNPLAGPLGQAAAARWLNPSWGPGAGANYWTGGPGTGVAIGSPLPKHVPAYWEVEWNEANAKRLDEFDLIYISEDTLAIPSPRAACADALRRAVLRGALLWVDNSLRQGPLAGTVVTDFEPPLGHGPVGQPQVPFVFGNPVAGAPALVAVDATHPLFGAPFSMTSPDVANLGATANVRSFVGLTRGLGVNNVLGASDLIPVVYDNAAAAPAVCVANIGDGAMLVTADDSGWDIQQWALPGSTMSDAPSGAQADCKLAYNAIAWAASWSQARGKPGAGASTPLLAAGPLDILWQYPGPTEPNGAGGNEIGPVVASPVTDGVYVYAVSLTSRNGVRPQLICLRARPEGLRVGGQPYDLSWRVTLPGSPRASSPTLATVNMPRGPGGSDIPVRVVLVSVTDPTGAGKDGEVLCYTACDNASLGIARGQLIWTYVASSYSTECNPEVTPSASVVDLSTPIVASGYVYVLASEYCPGLASGVDGTYGRVHVFDLRTGGQVANHPLPVGAGRFGYRFVYPDPDLDQNGQVDHTDANPVGFFAARYDPPDRRVLPCFHDPAWVANTGRSELPPEPTPVPTVSSAPEALDGTAAEAVVMFGTPASLIADPAAHQIHVRDWNASGDRAGGSDFAVVPTPYNASPPAGLPQYTLNAHYYRLRVQPGAATASDVERADTPNLDPFPLGTWDAACVAGADGNTFIEIDPVQAARAMLGLVYAAGVYADPLARQVGVPVVMATDIGESNGTLPGTVRWQRLQPHSVSAATAKAVDGTTVVSAGYPVGGVAGAVTGLAADTGAPKWTFDAGGAADYSLASGPTAANGMAYCATTRGRPDPTRPAQTIVSSEVYGLKTRPTLTIRLAPTTNAPTDFCGVRPGSITAFAVDTGAGIPFQNDDVFDHAQRFITLGPTTSRVASGRAVMFSYDIQAAPGSATFNHVANELHVFPPIAVFSYAPGFVKLRQYPADTATVRVFTLDGTPVTNALPGEGTVNVLGRTCVANGWLDLRAATIADASGNHPLPPGQELLIQYTGWNEDLSGWTTVPNTARNLPIERQQIPPYAGPALSSPAVGGTSAVIGTEGYRGTGTAIVTPPDALAWPYPPAQYETLLKVDWDPTTRAALGSRSIPAMGEAGSYAGVVPVVSSSPTISRGAVFAGVRCLDAATASAAPQLGFVAALAPKRTLICDTTRVIEAIGGAPARVWLGAQAPRATEDPIADAGTPIPQPFNRPAKATRLGVSSAMPLGQGDHTLVVDTGNNRVVEIDVRGNIVWPLDRARVFNGANPVRDYDVDYWTAPDYSDNRPNPTKLHLSRPTDAWRYITTWEDNYTYDAALGTYVPGTDGTPEITYHTAIADAGHARVVDLATVYLPMVVPGGGSQLVEYHRARILTPTQARVATTTAQLGRLEYTSAQPIFDPRDAENCIGYLCAVPNLNQLVILENGTRSVNPLTTTVIPSRTGDRVAGDPTWAYWAWLYTVGTTLNPLIFDNIRHAEYSVAGTRVYVTVAASRYRGRMTPQASAPAAAVMRGPGVFEFALTADPNAPGNWAQIAGNPSPDDPIWAFMQTDYTNSAAYRMAYYVLPGPSGPQVVQKAFDPSCATRLPDGRHIIATLAPFIENLTHTNAKGLSGTSLGSEVFEVVTQGGANYVDARNVIPDPRGTDWPDPLNQPSYAERCH